MKRPSQRRRLLFYAAIVFVVLPCLLFGATLLGFLAWSPVNCWHHDVDIHSGRLRYTRYIFWVPVRERFEDSSLTKALRREDFEHATASWHHAITLSPGVRNSPHYVFHSAIHQIRELELLWRVGDFTPEAQRASAKRVLQLWQKDRSDTLAGDYLLVLSELVISMDGTTNQISETDLPISGFERR